MSSNENQIQVEVFQPEINSQIKRTTLEELREWIKDGKLQPNHQVRVKNLSWVEAHKIPAFQFLFEAQKNHQAEQLNHSYSQTLTVAPEKVKPPIAEEKPFPKSRFFSLKKENDSSGKETSIGETPAESEPKAAAPSVVFQAFEKKFLTKDKSSKSKSEVSETSLKTQKKSSFGKKNIPAEKNKNSFSQNKNLILKRIVFFVAGCLLAGLLSYGGSYVWVYQLKSSAQIDEKSLPEIASLEDKLTSDKLGLRLKEERRKQELKESGGEENPAQHQDISQQIAQLEKQFDVQRKAVVENQKIKLQEADFDTTFSFSLAVLLLAFVLIGVFCGKDPQPIEVEKPAKTDSNVDDEQSITEQKSGEKQTETEAFETENEAFVETDFTDFQNDAEKFTKIVYVSENVSKMADAPEITAVEKTQLSIGCYQHRDKSPQFFCDICENYFCADCTKSVSESGNHCPYCKLTCKPVEIKINGDSQKSAPEEKKKTSLLELGKDSDFVVYDYPDERTRKLGIVPAIVIAALFSASISIFWVYKISPFLESRNQEISQNVSPAEAKNPEQPVSKNIENSGAATKNTETQNVPADSCVDPITKEVFKCDEETRKALFEQNRKAQSVENAQRKAAEKTSVLSGLTSSSRNPAAENAVRENPKTSAAGEERKEFEKQQLIKTFCISFVVIFGLLMLSRFFSKKKTQE